MNDYEKRSIFVSVAMIVMILIQFLLVYDWISIPTPKNADLSRLEIVQSMFCIIVVVELIKSAMLPVLAMPTALRKERYFQIITFTKTATLFGFVTMMFAVMYKIFGLHIPEHLQGDNFIYIYFSAATITKTGTGDVTPNDDSLVVCTIKALSGYILLGLYVFMISTFFTSTDKISHIDDQNSEKVVK